MIIYAAQIGVSDNLRKGKAVFLRDGMLLREGILRDCGYRA